MKSIYSFLDTPSLIIDKDIAYSNIKMMQERATALGIALRPHIKTHRMPYFAKIQVAEGAIGITVAKIGEAEVMADNGISDIFIANEIVGISKYNRIRELARKIKIRIGVDNSVQVDQIEQVFEGEPKPLEVLIEYEVGENRSGVITDQQLIDLANYIKTKKNIVLKGIFSHEGHTYKANDRASALELSQISYEKTLRAANIIRDLGAEIDTVSVGATPSILNGAFIKGITEFRPGTYIFMDLGQAGAIHSLKQCAATVLATIISKPTNERVVLDTGAKALVAQNRETGICATNGFGYVKRSDDVRIVGLFDEHGLIINKNFCDVFEIGDKIEIIPSHICPTVNLYDEAYIVSDGVVVEVVPILCRGKSK